MISEQRMKELEELLGKKTQESEQLAKERQEVETECEEVRREATDLEQQSRTFLEDMGVGQKITLRDRSLLPVTHAVGNPPFTQRILCYYCIKIATASAEVSVQTAPGAMNSSSYTSNMSMVEADFLTQAWSFILSARLELSLFVAALVAHLLLFGNSTPQKSKRSKETFSSSPQHFSNAKDVEVAFADAVRSGNARQVLNCWSAAKKFPDTIDIPLANVVEAMQRFKKDADYIARELSAYLTKHRSTKMQSINDLLESLAKRHDSEFVESVLKILPAGFSLDSRSYEILMNMHFTMRNFQRVDAMVEQAKASKVPLTTRASIVIIKTALKTENFEDALATFRELKALWQGHVGPSTAPRQIVAQLVEMACKEHELSRFLPELQSVPLSEDAVHLMVTEAVREKNEDLLEQVEQLAREKGIDFSESTYAMLIKGYKGRDEKVELLFLEALDKKSDAGTELCLALLLCCQQTRNFALAERAYEHFSKQMSLSVLAAFIRFHSEVENYERVCDMYEKDAAPMREKAAGEGRSILDSRMERCVMNAALKFCSLSVWIFCIAMAQFDVILFGATGFTGSLMLKYLAQKTGVKYALCGRNKSKLEQAIAEMSSKPEILVLDVVNASLNEVKEVVKKTKCVCTSIGPFVECGEPLVQACAELGVDYADTSGESTFMRQMIEKYDAIARQSGARIAIHCGQDCVPWDLMVWKLWKLNADLVGVKILGEMKGVPSGGTLNTAMLNMRQKPSKGSLGFDPLYLADGKKSEFLTQVDLPK
eukprot:symbB.v1.2.013993.t1/scaffold1009.1/size144543/1